MINPHIAELEAVDIDLSALSFLLSKEKRNDLRKRLMKRINSVLDDRIVLTILRNSEQVIRATND